MRGGQQEFTFFKYLVVGLALAPKWAPAVAVAQEEVEKSDFSFTLGGWTWVATGNTKWSFQGPLFVGGPTAGASFGMPDTSFSSWPNAS